MGRLAELITGHRIATSWFVFGVSLLAILGLTRLEFDDVARGIFRSDDADFSLLEEVYEDFGSDDNDCVVVLEAPDFFRPDAAQDLRRLSNAIEEVEGIEAVLGLPKVLTFDDGLLPQPLLPVGNGDPQLFDQAREAARTNPLVQGHLLSADGSTTVLLIRLAGGSLGVTQIEPVVSALRGIINEWEKDTEIRASLTGVPTIRVEIYGTVERETRFFMGVGALICFALAFLLFRSARAVMVANVGPFLGAMWTMGAMGLLGTKLDLLSTVLPTLVITIGFTDSVHLVVDMRRSRAAGASAVEAARDAIRHLGLPCALTSLTTAIGFGSLTIGHLEIIRTFGSSAALGVLLTFVAVITTAPLLASLLGEIGGTQPASPRQRRRAERAAAWIARVTRWAKPVAAVGVLLTLGLLSVSFELRPDNRLTEATPRDNESYRGLRQYEQAFGGVMPAYVLLEWDESASISAPEVQAAVREVEDLLAAKPNLAEPLSVADLIDVLPGDARDFERTLPLLPQDLVRRFVRPDLRRTLIAATMPEMGSRELNPLIAQLERDLTELEERHPSVRAHLTGTAVIGRGNINRMIIDLARGLGFAALIIFMVMSFEFRSLALGAISLIPNLFPLVVVASSLVLLDYPLQITSAIVFTVLLGIAVDDTIHVLARFRRELDVDGDVHAAAVRSIRVVGKALLITTVVLISGFSATFTSVMPTVQLFAAALCVGLLAALIGDLVLLPALLVILFKPQRRRKSAS